MISWVLGPTELETRDVVVSRQAHPQQKFDHSQMLFAPTPNLVPFIVQYALNHWVYTAVNKLAPIAAAADFMVTSRPDGLDVDREHGLVQLLGRYGQPNRDTDSYEWWETHFQNLLISGNSYWLWESDRPGAPTRLRMLEPENMKIRPGVNETVGKYTYWANGVWIDYDPVQITHFKRANPYSRYYGLSALAVLFRLAAGDNEMLQWNNDFFDNELGMPSGIIIVPSSTSESERKRIEDEMIAKHGEKRRIMVIKSDAGKTVWLDAGLKHKDYDFEKGRTLHRKAIFEALDLPLGVMAETSTEAHAIVSERRMMEAVRTWHIRTTRKLNVDGLSFWPMWASLQTDFEDVRRNAVDWRREKLRRDADEGILTVDEMRMREYKLGPIDGETVRSQNGNSGEQQKSSGDSGGNS
ncbi:hypothetical protein LCGC14_1085760 [marine sediment metagenome]|uniref:Phage portal protein n=1 Tax=marine sediment metagenome TaxID=412755 RepID=A0A0F9QJT7_9ZZZZ